MSLQSVVTWSHDLPFFGTARWTHCGLAFANTTIILDNNHSKYPSITMKLSELVVNGQLQVYWAAITSCWPSFTQLSKVAWEEGGEPVLTESILTSRFTGTVHPTLWWYRGFLLVHGCWVKFLALDLKHIWEMIDCSSTWRITSSGHSPIQTIFI